MCEAMQVIPHCDDLQKMKCRMTSTASVVHDVMVLTPRLLMYMEHFIHWLFSSVELSGCTCSIVDWFCNHADLKEET